jgi:hypothetical protein
MEKQIVEFNIQDIWPIALVFIIAGLGIAYGLQAMGEAKSDMVTDSVGCGLNSTGGTGGTLLYNQCPAEFNATNSAISGVAKFPSKFGTIVTIVIAAIIIMILVRYLGASAN